MSRISAPWPELRLRFLLLPVVDANRLARLKRSETVTFLPMDAIGTRGEIDYSTVKEKEEVSGGSSLFFDGDVVVAKITPCFENGKGAYISGAHNGVGYGTTELHVLRPGPLLDPRFLYYVTASPAFRRQGEGYMIGTAGQKRVPEAFIRDYRIRVPPLETQRAVCRFLDAETARIDALVAEKERLLGLLIEKRSALAARAVTRGLDERATVTHFGAPWLGTVPAHWTVRRARWLFTERDERSDMGEGELLTVSHLTGVTPRAEKDVSMFLAETMEGYKVCRAGDLAINTMWAWMGAMGVSPLDGLVSPSYNVYKPAASLLGEYLDVLVRTPQFAHEVFRLSTGVWSSRLRLYPEAFFDIRIPVPSLDEQRAIVAHIRSETARLQATGAEAGRTIELLKERRSALIAAAVTGEYPVGVVAC